MITANNIMSEIQNIKNWKKTHKKSYEIYMCRPKLGTKCSNKLEGANYTTNEKMQFILSGTVGELWVIGVDKLAKTYTFLDGTPITPDTLKKKCDKQGNIPWTILKTRPDAVTNWAFLLPKTITNFPIQTSWGTLIANRPGVQHGFGDFLICSDNNGQPNLNDMWVVNGLVFPKTYDLHAFPNMFNDTIIKASLKYPEVDFIKGSASTSASSGDSQKTNKPGAKRIEYEIVGRYMNGKEVTGYHLKALNADKECKYTREQTCLLVGREQVTNCAGQLYQNKVLLRGKGINLDNLPIMNDPIKGEKTKDGNNSQTKGTQKPKEKPQKIICNAIMKGLTTKFKGIDLDEPLEDDNSCVVEGSIQTILNEDSLISATTGKNFVNFTLSIPNQNGDMTEIVNSRYDIKKKEDIVTAVTEFYKKVDKLMVK